MKKIIDLFYPLYARRVNREIMLFRQCSDVLSCAIHSELIKQEYNAQASEILRLHRCLLHELEDDWSKIFYVKEPNENKLTDFARNYIKSWIVILKNNEKPLG